MLTCCFFLGIVRAPVATTIMQVMSRLLLVWAITYPYPFVTQAPSYASMLFAWSVTEVIRYSYFATSLVGLQPWFLTFLRYNTFFILYPLGIFSECSLIFITSKFLPGLEKYILYAILAIYVPGKLDFCSQGFLGGGEC
jgi:very-long-chain (3R)-3-hydroxyacyl-CoA dehydratase